MITLITEIFGSALILFMAHYCGKSLAVFQASKKAVWASYLFSCLSVVLFPFWTTLLLMYLLVQAFSDAKDGMVDVALNLQANAILSAALLSLYPKPSGMIFLAGFFVFLYVTRNIFSTGDQKGLFAIALWGAIYLLRGTGIFSSGAYLPIPMCYGLLVAFLGVCLFGLCTKKWYDVPLFPWLWFGMTTVSGAMKFLV